MRSDEVGQRGEKRVPSDLVGQIECLVALSTAMIVCLKNLARLGCESDPLPCS
jgi:hypothetical protein